MKIEKQHTNTGEQFKRLLYAVKSEDIGLYKLLLFIWGFWLNGDDEDWRSIIHPDLQSLYPENLSELSKSDLSSLDPIFEEILGISIEKQIEKEKRDRG
jgi:hypothetical protein